MYRKVAGLSQLEPGYKKFQVKPTFVKGIEEWGTEFDSVYGKIVANTSCKAGKIHVHVRSSGQHNSCDRPSGKRGSTRSWFRRI